MKFKRLTVDEWQQFQHIEIDFHDRLTIITGANGSGKTTILANILAKHSGWGIKSISTPKRDKMTGVFSYLTRFYNGFDRSGDITIGDIEYWDNKKSKLQVQNKNSAQYEINIKSAQSVNCFFIPSHRSVFQYQPVANIPFNKKNKKSAFNEVSNAIRQKYLGQNNQSTSLFMKNTLIGWAVQGYGVHKGTKEIMPRDDEQIKYYEGFESVLKKILPKSLGFEGFEIRQREIIFICNQGNDEFVFEQASGGICTLIEIAWQIYMFSTKEISDFTVLIDEIENHLHPTMQREILHNLTIAFPNTTFIVSTHSPLIVGSVKESNVYVLKYNETNKVISQKLDLVNKAKTATEILDEVLGVSFTMPIWAEEHLNRIVDKFSRKEMNREDFSNLRNELQESGLENLIPSAIYKLVDGK